MVKTIEKKNILLTGSNGMVGKNFFDLAKRNSLQVLTPSRSELDLLDEKQIFRYLNDKRPNAVIHAAGRVGGIQANINNPYQFLYENCAMGLNIVNACLEQGIKNFLNLASTCMYPAEGKNPLFEDQILSGKLEQTNEGYALAKIVTTKICDYVGNIDCSLNYKTLIPCNIYGKYDSFDTEKSHLLAAIIAKVHYAKENGKKNIEVWGDGKSRREFLYAADLAKAMMKALDEIENIPNYMNIGVGHDFSVKDYYQIVAETLQWKGELIFDLSKPSGVKQKLSDISKQVKWGWKPKTSLRKGILETYGYYLEGVIK